MTDTEGPEPGGTNSEPIRPVGRSNRPLLRRVGIVAILALLGGEFALLVPFLSGTGHALSHLKWNWLALALLAEVASMVYFARLQRRMLRAGGIRVPLLLVVATALAANAMSVTLPAGPVLSTGYTFQRMRAWGASAPLATWGMVASGILSTLALGVIGILGSGFASGRRPNPIVVVVEIILALAVVYSVRRLVRHPDRMMHVGEYSVAHINRLLRKPPERGQDKMHNLLDEMLLIRPRARDWFLGLNFAILNWVADLVCLIAACRAVGADGPTLTVALVAYAAGMAVSSLPLLPGGIGVVDGTLVLALTRGGLPVSIATAAVVVYRLIGFVMVAALGWTAWGLLRRSDRLRAIAAGTSATVINAPRKL